jgi:hypothetical protein
MEDIMTKFPDVLNNIKSLCLRIRKILFPLDKDERINFSTLKGDPDQLYNPIIAVYNNAINRL